MDCILSRRKSVKDINEMFRERNNQVQTTVEKSSKKLVKRGYNNIPNNPKGDLSKAYLSKDIDKYSSRDILYFYKDLAEKNGMTFYSNMNLDRRYMRNIKQLQETFDNEAILDMYKFLFESGQNYLDMRKCNPGILLTGWCNKIVADTQDYIDGVYKNSTKPKREYDGNDDDESTIGEW